MHFLFALPPAIIYYDLTKDIIAALVFIAASVLIDADHIFDYIMTHKKFDLKHFLQGGWFKDKLYVLLHSYEFLLILVIAYTFTKNALFLAVTAGCCYHILLDVAAYNSKFSFYSLIYRMMNNFEMKVFCNG
jgi:hypothetical protein